MPGYSEKEKLIIDTARKRFAHYGFSKTTMDEIATDIEMGKASLYYYFPTKEKLFQAVIQLELSEFAQVIENGIKKKISASKKLLQYVNKRLSYSLRILNLGVLSVHTVMNNKSVYGKVFLDFEKREIILINKIIKEGIKNGEFNKNISRSTIEVFLHILQGLRLRMLKRIKNNEYSDIMIKTLQKEMIIAAKIFIKGISK